MKLEQSFEVGAPIDVVWNALVDLERVAPCLPGASINERDDDGTYRGTFSVKLGPTTAAYNGTIRIEEADEAAHRATLVAKGSDKRGQGGASATIVNTLSETSGGTRVDAVTDFTITGRLARFGRGGMIQDVSNRLLRDFATCLQGRLAQEQPSAPAPTGAQVTAGDAPPEALAAAAPEAAGQPAASDATASATAPPAPASGAQPSPSPAPPAPASGAQPSPAAAPPAAQPVKGFSLLLSVLWERIKRLLGRG